MFSLSFLLHGLWEERRDFVVPWLVAFPVATLELSAGAAAYGMVASVALSKPLWFLLVLGSGAFLLAALHAWTVVFSHYVQLGKKGNGDKNQNNNKNNNTIKSESKD